MSRYFSGRIGQAMLEVLPGDAILIKFQNPDMGLSPAQIADMRAAYGADIPVWQQYFHTLGNFLRGDLGYSIQAGVPVTELLSSNFPPTLRLAVLGFVLATVVAIAIAFLSSLLHFGWLTSLFISIPTFWLGIALIQFFSFHLRWIPVINPGEWVGLILTIVTLAVPISA